MRKQLCAALLFLALTLASCGTGRVAETGSPAPEPSNAPTLSSSSAPDPTVTSESAPVYTPTPEPVQTPASGQPNDAYFDNALFIGDSIMEGIRQYVAKNRSVEPTLGNAQFLTDVAGVSIAGLAQTGMGYRYQGADQSLQQILTQIRPARIFLMLGLNDLAAADPDIGGIISSYAQLISQIRQAVPGVEVIVLTNPPKVASLWLPDYTANRNFSNALIADFVEALIQMCGSQGIPYINTHQTLLDENGALPDSYCRDGYVHLNDTGSKVVVDALYAFAGGRG